MSTEDTEVALPDDPQAYVAQVMAEIAEEVRLRRASGDLPPRLERELDELFLAHSPVAGRGRRPGRGAAHGRRGHLHRPGRAGRVRARRRRLREEGHALAPALVRRLGHPPDEPVRLGRQPRPAHRRRPAGGAAAAARGPAGAAGRRGGVPRASTAPGPGGPSRRVAAVAKAPGRVLHAACGDGWLVRRIVEAGGDAYGVDPRARIVDAGRARRAGPAQRDRWPSHLRRGRRGGPGRARAQRDRRGHGRRRAGAPARRPSGPGWRRAGRWWSTRSARRPGRSPTPRPRPTSRPGGRCVPTRGVALLRAARLQAEAQSGAGGADYLVTAVRARHWPAPSHRRSGERRRRGAGGRPPVRPHAQPPRRHGHPHAARCATRCAGPGGARRSSPRPSTTTWPARPSSTGCTPSTPPPGDVAVYQFTTSSAVAGYLAEHGLPAHPRLPQLHRTRALRRLGARAAWSGRPRPPRSWPCWRPPALLGPGQERLQRADAAAGRVPAHGGGAGAGRLRRGSPPRPTPGWPPSWPGARAEGGADILFVGRVVPSKAQHELVKALWAYRRLYDAGGPAAPGRRDLELRVLKALLGFVDDLGLSEAVRIAGEVSDASLAALLRRRRRLPLALGARGLRRAPGRGDGGRRPGGDARRRARWRDTVADAALVLEAGDPSYVAAALHRVCTDERLRRRRSSRPGAAGPPSSRATRRPSRSSTPSPAPWAGHEPEGGLRHPALRHCRSWAAPRRRCASWPSTCAPGPAGRPRSTPRARSTRITWADELEPGTTRAQRRVGAPPPLRAGAHCPTSTAWTGCCAWPRGWRRGSRGRAGSTTTGRSRPQLVEAVVRVGRRRRRLHAVPLPPDRGRDRPGADAGRVPPGRPRRAGPLPLGVPRHVRRRRRVLLLHGRRAHAGGAHVPGGGAAPDRARPRRGGLRGTRAAPAASVLGLGDRPYVVSVGRVDEHKGSKMLASYFATYKERHPGPLALALVGPVAFELPPHPDIVVTGGVDEA